MSERMLVDARGAYCPGPLMELIASLKLIEIGEEIEVLSSDKGSAKDIPAWVAKVKHEVVSNEEQEDAWHIVVRKLK
jgi:tRNA 2-thiouridine synthesizing protein A